MRNVRFILIGLGNLGRRFCEILVEKETTLKHQYGLDLRLVGAADSQGAAYHPAGLDLGQVIELKRAGDTIAHYSYTGELYVVYPQSALELVATAEADLLLEASPVNLPQGAEPGLGCVRTALQRGMHVVTPNKGPIVTAFRELHELAAEHGVQLRFDGTVAGGLPALNLGQRDLRGATIHMIEAVPNLVTGYIMDLVAGGVPWDEALARAREGGALEADPSFDLDGLDAAVKLVILANSVLDYPARLDDVNVVGISASEGDSWRAARAEGKRIRLVARAERRTGGTYDLSVAPVALPSEHPLGRLGRKQMGIVYSTDIYGTIAATIEEPSPIPSAATMLRDLLDIYSQGA